MIIVSLLIIVIIYFIDYINEYKIITMYQIKLNEIEKLNNYKYVEDRKDISFTKYKKDYVGLIMMRIQY